MRRADDAFDAPLVPAAPMKLTTLGTAKLAPDADSPAATLAVGKPLALLIYLSAAPNRTASRSSLISLLWSDLEPDAAKHALRQTIWYLKKRTGRDLIVSDADILRFVADVAVDRDDLLAASRAGDHARVIELYSGAFVPSFAAPGGAGFEEWASLERRRLLEVFRHSAEAVVAGQLGTGRARDAIALARRLRDQDVNHEGGWRLLIEVCVSAGDLLDARAESEALLQLAERDGIELEPATRATLRTIRSSAATSHARTVDASDSTLVGREEVFATLLQAWEETKAGKVTRIHVTARAGLGKTRLLRDFATRIRAMRGRVASVGGSLGTRDVELAVAGDLAAALAALPGRQAIAPESAATLVDLNPSLSTWFDRPARPAPREDLMRARSLAVRELMTAVSFEHPVAILVDDLHWWDDPSSTLLTAAIDGLGDARVLLVTAGRPEARRGALVATAATRHVALDPLTAAQVEELVLGIASLPADPWAATFANELWRASRGSPLLAIGMLRHLEERALLERVDGSWSAASPDALSTELQQGDVLHSRLAELDRTDFWLLTLLAAGGSALRQETLVAASELGGAEVLERMASMESRGFVVKEDDGWRMSHDEFAGEVLHLATADAITRANGRLGRTLAAPPLDEGRVRRAAQLLRHSDDATARVDLFRAFGAHRYALGDRRSVSAVAADLLGASASPSEVAELRRGAPILWRVGLVSPVRRAAAVFGVLAATALTALAITSRADPPPPDAVLALAYLDSANHVRFETVDVRRAGWSPQDTLVSKPWNAYPVTLQTGNGFNATYSPTTGTLVTSQSVEGDSTIELFVQRRGAAPVRFLPGWGDDGSPAFSPDGRLIAFQTARWDSLMHYDLAIASLSDTTPTRLTRSTSTDGGPRWSPDGSRIAFERLNWGARANQVCVIEVDSRQLQCRDMSPDNIDVSPLGWLDRDRVVVLFISNGSSKLAIMNWSSGEMRSVVDLPHGFAQLSEDGSWLYCDCALSSDGLATGAIVPLAAPNLVRPIRPPSDRSRVFLFSFWISSRASMTPSRVLIAPQPVALPGVPVQMRATFYDGRNNVVGTLGAARWRVLDQSAGSIDSLRGVLLVTGATPSVSVEASVGRSVADTLHIRVDRDSARLLSDERWTNGLAAWFPFGLPEPAIETQPGRDPTFLNNGNGSFESGVISRRTFDGSGGLAVEMDISTPIKLLQWQVVKASMISSADTMQFASARGLNAIPRFDRSREWCGFGYPEEGRLSGTRRLLAVSSRTRLDDLPVGGFDDGRPWRLRLQLFPDGRCGVAVNGVPLMVLDGGAAPSDSLRLMILGNSYHTRIGVGRVRLFSGVPPGVDWGKTPTLR